MQAGLVNDGIKNVSHIVENELTTGIIYGATSDDLILLPENKVLCKGSKLHTGIGVGYVTFSVDKAKKRITNGDRTVLFCRHFDPNDLELLTKDKKLISLVTTEGGPSSHMGIVASVLKIPSVMGIEDAVIDESNNFVMITTTEGKVIIKKGDIVSVDSYTGIIYSGEVEVVAAERDEFTKQLTKEWERKYGRGNIWADFASREKLDKLEVEFAKILYESNRYRSKKAAQTHIINEFFDSEIAIYTDIIKKDDTDKILDTIDSIKKGNGGVWLRSCYNPDLLEAPYASVDFTRLQRSDIKDWLENPDSGKEYSRFGNYKAWDQISKEDVSYKMEYALVPRDPVDKLAKDLYDEHFVFSLRCENGEASRVVIDISDGAPHMRMLGSKKQSELMHVAIVSNPAMPSKIGRYYYTFGRSSFRQKVLDKYVSQEYVFNRLDEIGVKPKSVDEFVAGVNRLIENGQLDDVDLESLIKERNLKVIKYVSGKIIKDWWKKFDIPTRMSILNKITGASILEVQGRLSEKIKWIKIYGAKGQEESEIYGKLGE